MTYEIIYQTKTGNTALLAERIKSALPAKDCVFFGTLPLTDKHAEIIFVGFWTDKGNCCEEIASFLQSLHHQTVFLFGTAGFGGDESYFARILSNVTAHLDDSNTIADTYMCQGRMPDSVRQRYESIMEKDPDKMQSLIANFDSALSHPNENDLLLLEKSVLAI